jgi:hypothetical protein
MLVSLELDYLEIASSTIDFPVFVMLKSSFVEFSFCGTIGL